MIILRRNMLLNKNNPLLKKREGKILLLGYLYFILLIGIFAFYSNFYLIWLAIFALSLILILPNHYYIGLPLIIVLTMIFERFFTLQGLIIDRYIYKLYPIDIIMLFSFIALAISIKIKEFKLKIKFSWPELLLIAFMILVTTYLIRAMFDINADLAVAFSSFKNYVWYPLIYFFIILTIKNEIDFKKIVHLILIVGSIIIVFLFIGLIRGNGLWTEYTPLSTSGTRYLAGTHAFYMLLCLILGISLLAFKRLSSVGFASLIGGFWLIGIILSLMRHLWLDVVFSFILLFFLLPQENKKELYKYIKKSGLIILSTIALLITISGLFYLTNFSQNFREQTNNLITRATSLINIGEDTSASWRLQLWYDAKKSWQKNPIFGVGLGKSILIDTGDWQNFEEIRNMHNSILALLVQLGILGFLIFFAFILASGISAWKQIYNHKELLPYYLGLATGCAAFLFASLFQPYLETNLMAIFFWIFLGLLRTSFIIKENENITN